MSSAYIEINILHLDKVQALQRFVERLREVKQSGSFPSDEEWAKYFDSSSRSYFEELTPEEVKEWERDWKAAPVEQRQKDLSLWPHWDFGSFLDALKNGEFLVAGLEITGTSAKLLFEPIAYPYGGPDCLIAIVEAFGQEAAGLDDGAGYRQHTKHERWKPIAKRHP